MEKKEINDLVRKISSELQQLEGLVSTDSSSYFSRTFIKPPKGIISYSNTHKKKYPFLVKEFHKSNISYHLMINDLFRWILYKFQLYAVVKEMMIKIAIGNYGNIIAAVIIPIAKIMDKDEKDPRFRKATSILEEKKIITKKLKKRLREIYIIRNKQHVETMENWEFEKYDLKDYYETEETWQELISKLKKAFNEGLIPEQNLSFWESL